MIRWPCTCSEEDVPHNYISEREHAVLSKELQPIIDYKIECSECRHESEIPKEDWDQTAKEAEIKAQRSSRTYLTRYPRIEPHTGALVKSRDHELETVKAAGFHVAEHGINDAYNDELCEKMRSDRQNRETRRNAIRKKREIMIREGVFKPKKKVKTR